jgi:Dyp-type peroxidase family
MRHDTPNKDCGLAGAIDLSVIAPVLPGFVPALDAVTYKTRVKRVLRTLHAGRGTAHEFDLARLLSDAVERVGRIHSVRIELIEQPPPAQDLVLLAVTYDGPSQAYVRTIWQKVARLLDLIFCNTVGYVNGWENSFEDWAEWLRWRQNETQFLYAMPGITVDDQRYLRLHERLDRARAGAELQLTRITAPIAEEIAWQWFSSATDPMHGDLGRPLDSLVEARPEVFRQGLRALAGLFRLADVYPPGTADGRVLHRAAVELLPDFVRLLPNGPMFLQTGWERAQARFEEALHWLNADENGQSDPAQFAPPPLPRQPVPLPDVPAAFDPADVQGGIVKSYKTGGHGALLLLAFDSAPTLAAWLDSFTPTTAAAQAGLAAGDVALNLALSVHGLRLAGLNDADVEALPSEFALGMERRAGVLGDLRINHPQRWRLPVRNWSQGVAAEEVADDAQVERVALSGVHAVLQARLVDPDFGFAAANARALILQELKEAIAVPAAGIVPLSLQWLDNRLSDDADPAQRRPLEHFGFRDGLSQPRLHKAEAGKFFKNQVHLGEVLIGYDHAGGVAPPPLPDAEGPGGPRVPRNLAALKRVRKLLHNGSFLVVRKLRQDLRVWEQVLDKGQADTQLPADELKARMMGRWPEGHAQAGQPLITPPASAVDALNDFVYRGDPDGRRCPVHAHIRRANPRSLVPPPLAAQLGVGGRPPRLLRRGMTYGPRHVQGLPEADRQASLSKPRGLLFMAYNASIGEQFEVVQRWLSGGNSAAGLSGQSCPFVGVPEAGVPRHFRFEKDEKTHRLTLDGSNDMLAEPQPLVRLEWGGYFLTPSLSALRELAGIAGGAGSAQAQLGWSAAKGQLFIEQLRKFEQANGAAAAREAWKSLLEDPGAAAELWTADIWAAVRDKHGGLLRTPYGVLVASPEGVRQVLANGGGWLTSTAYLPRMRRSFGAIYLGMDAGQEDARYEREAEACNRAIMALTAGQGAQQIRARSRQAVKNWVDARVAESMAHAQTDEALRRQAGAAPRDELRWTLTLELRELIEELLAVFCEAWFGLEATDNGPLRRGGLRWTWRPGDKPFYPGHFMAPSRYIFQPHPGRHVEQVGAEHGQAMLAAVEALLQSKGWQLPQAPVSHAVLSQPPGSGDHKLAARNIVGALMGMVPTVDANLRRVCHLWLSEGTLWALRGRAATLGNAELATAFMRAMAARAAPDTLWRTVEHSFTLGEKPGPQLALQPGELVVAGLISATQRGLELAGAAGEPAVDAAFGGRRSQPLQPAGEPVHACPGYGPAIAMMLGFIEELVRSPRPWRAGPAPLTLALEGRLSFVPPRAVAAVKSRRSFRAPLPMAELGRQRPSRRAGSAKKAALVPLAAFGDSWLDWVPIYPELIGALPQHGFEVVLEESDTGRTLAQMRAMAEDLAALLADEGLDKPDFKALLIGGGGNDLVHPLTDATRCPLYRMLVPGQATAADSLHPAELQAFVHTTLKGHYQHVLGTLRAALPQLPLFVHAYDDPVPDGRDAKIFGIGPGPWLEPVFKARGMLDLKLNREVMRLLIAALNDMIAALVPAFGPHTHHLKLNGVLPTDPDSPDAHHDFWDNELHPGPQGYALLAAEVARQLKAQGL